MVHRPCTFFLRLCVSIQLNLPIRHTDTCAATVPIKFVTLVKAKCVDSQDIQQMTVCPVVFQTQQVTSNTNKVHLDLEFIQMYLLI